MNFEFTEALAYWAAVKWNRSMHGEQIAKEPVTGVDDWPESLPCLMVADLQWRTEGSNDTNRTTFSLLVSKILGGEDQRVQWTVPERYRYPDNMVSLQSVTADDAKKVIIGMQLTPDRLIQAWFNAKCTSPETTAEPMATNPPNLIVKHSTKIRRDVLTPVIEFAQSQCRNPRDTAEVWAALQVFAEKKIAPLIGATEDGLQYLKNGDAANFNRESLRKRLGR